MNTKYEKKFTATDKKIIKRVSKKGIFISITNDTNKIAKTWPKIAIHLILIRFPSNIVFIKN